MSASSKKKLRKEQNAALLTEKQLKAQKEAKKLKLTTSIFVAVIALVLVAGLVLMGINIVKSSGIIDRNTTALTVGEHKLNSVEMTYYFTDMVNRTYSSWEESYGDYTSYFLSMMGLDLSQPLDEQEHSEGGTWADYFMDQAVQQATANYALYDLAIAEGYAADDDVNANIESNLSTIQMNALFSGYDLKSYLKLAYGSGASEASLREYLTVTTIATQYYNDHLESLNYDDAAIRAHEADRALEYNSYTYDTYYVNYNNFLPDDVEDPTDAQVDEAIAAAKATAEELAAFTTTEELDAAIAALEINAENSTAASTKNTNTLYSAVPSSIQDWIADTGRQAGDTGVLPVEGSYTNDAGETTQRDLNYYVVLFHSVDDNTKLMSNVRHLLVKFEEDDEGNLVEGTQAACKAEAEGYLADWKAGAATEESFIELVQQYSVDGSASDGGLFEDIHPGSAYVTNWLNWATDSSRKAGDTGIVETEYGYHVMYYVGDSERSYRDQMIIDELTESDMESWYNGIVDAAAVTEGNLNRIETGLVLANA